MFDRTTG